MNKIKEGTVTISTFSLLFQSGMPSEHYVQPHIIHFDRDPALLPSNSTGNNSLLKFLCLVLSSAHSLSE